MSESAIVPIARPAISEADVEALTGLRRPRWQRFVAALACGTTLADAVRFAGYQTRVPRQHGVRLQRRPDISAALATVRAEMAKRNQFTLDHAMAQFRADRGFAIETRNATAAVRASELMARMTGHLVDRLDARVQQVPFRIEIDTRDGGGDK